ncbi:MAG: glutaredoxin [Euryarchaeota archaeon]|nr:glutaredoxin [Euryarchaeota archaeon]|tara:strand:+ start:332 stop:598 length:267 start_codon:yes stop_codon:yes gene_type:complete
MESYLDLLRSADTDFIFFSQTICPYCVRASRTLEANGLTFTEVNLDHYDGMRREIVIQTGHRTVPVVFDIRGETPIFVGGSDHLLDYL